MTHLGGRVVLLVDEAGMAGSRDVAALLSHAPRHGAQVILAGDRCQLRSVEPGAPFAALADALDVARLEEVRRQSVAWQREASLVFARGDAVEGLARYDAKRRVVWAADGEDAVRRLADAWERNRRLRPGASRLVLAGRNAEVHALNRELRARALAAGDLGADALAVRTLHAGGRRGARGEVRDMEIRAGDRVVVGVTLTRSGRDLLTNDVATVTGFTRAADPVLRLRLDRTGREVALRLSELAPAPARRGEAAGSPEAPVLQHAYALTVHKAQGRTVDYTLALGGAGLDASRAYVAMTRHRRDAALFADAGAVAERLAEAGVTPTREAVRQAFLRAARAPAEGRNAADFVADRAAWLRTGDPRALPRTATETRAQAVVRLAAEAVGRHATRAARAAPRLARAALDRAAAAMRSLRQRIGPPGRPAPEIGRAAAAPVFDGRPMAVRDYLGRLRAERGHADAQGRALWAAAGGDPARWPEFRAAMAAAPERGPVNLAARRALAAERTQGVVAAALAAGRLEERHKIRAVAPGDHAAAGAEVERAAQAVRPSRAQVEQGSARVLLGPSR